MKTQKERLSWRNIKFFRNNEENFPVKLFKVSISFYPWDCIKNSLCKGSGWYRIFGLEKGTKGILQKGKSCGIFSFCFRQSMLHERKVFAQVIVTFVPFPIFAILGYVTFIRYYLLSWGLLDISIRLCFPNSLCMLVINFYFSRNCNPARNFVAG